MSTEAEKLLNLEAAPDATGTKETTKDETTTLALNVTGMCFAIAAVSSFLHLLLDSFDKTWLWPFLGFFLLMGHLLLLLAHCHAQQPWDAPFRLSSAALVCETVAYIALIATYLSPSFIVPFWWWHAVVLVFIWPAMVLLIAVLSLHFCAALPRTESTGPDTERLSRWSHRVAMVGLIVVVWKCFALALLLLFAGGSVVRDYILSILPDGVGPPGDPGGVQVLSPHATSVWKVDICDMTQKNCSLNDFPMYTWTAVSPGGDTKCLLGEYAFRVYRADPSKVLILFDGGGSCWNWQTFVSGMCSPAVFWSHTGIHNVMDPDNPYYGFTVIEIAYCSGDAFAGTATHFWIMPAQTASAWKPMRGYANTLAVVEWTKAQFEGVNPALPSPLEKFVVAGESAGALGVQIWQNEILKRLKGFYREKDTMFLADSFNGLQVKGPAVESGVMAYWGFCDSGLVPAELQDRCFQKELGISDIVLYNLRTYPNVRLLMIESKFDKVQILFADLVAAFNNLWAIIHDLFTGNTEKVSEKFFSRKSFYRDLTHELTLYAAHPQFAVFLVNSDFHGFTNLNMHELNMTTPKGKIVGCNDPTDGDRLLSWLSFEVSQTNQCSDFENETVEEWTGHFCNASIPWSPGTC